MTTHKNLLTLCVAALFTLGLAACGSDGSDPVTTMPDPMPDPDADAERMAISNAITAATEAAALVNDTADQAVVDAADMAVMAAMNLIDGATHISADDTATFTASLTAISGDLTMAMDSRTMTMNRAMQRQAISEAIAAASTAVAAVDNDATDQEVADADAAVAAASMAIANAANVPEAEKAANTGTVDALAAQLASAKTSRQMAMDAAAEAQRMANIAAAQSVLSDAEDALAALADDATDEQKRDAQRMIEAAANALRDVLQMNGGSAADIEAAIRTAQTAKVAADALQATITAAAEAEERRQMAAINAAQMRLSEAEAALAALGEDATDKEMRDAHREVENAADDLITVLEDNGDRESIGIFRVSGAGLAYAGSRGV